jgi:UTP-glucose-1-phosphate uridylyltransferase
MASMKVRKAVFPAAGMGTRFLPATKAMPKEMLPLVDKPLIQYGVEEAVAAGCTEIIIVTGRGKTTMEDHFDKSFELEATLAARGKTELLELARSRLPEADGGGLRRNAGVAVGVRGGGGRGDRELRLPGLHAGRD